MIAIFDHITAVLVGGVVLLLLFAIQHRSTDHNIEQSSMYSAKKFSLEFADWLESDLQTLGTNILAADSLFLEPFYTDSNTTLFTFFRDSVDFGAGDTLRIQTRYNLDSTGTLVFPDTTYQLFELLRSERIESAGGGFDPWADTGASPGTLTHFRIDLLNARGQFVTAENQTAFIRVAFGLTPPYNPSQRYLKEMAWATTINVRKY